MSDLHRIQSATTIAGLDQSHSPQAIIQNAATSIRHLLDKDVTTDDPRCLALLQLANLTRLHILPRSNDDAITAKDLTARALHIDLSAATTAAVMGLQNASALPGTAVPLASREPPRRTAPSSSTALKFRLLPKLSQAAVDAIFHLIRTDHALPLRPKHLPPVTNARSTIANNNTFSQTGSAATADNHLDTAALQGTDSIPADLDVSDTGASSLAVASGRVQKLRTSARQSTARKRRAMYDALGDTTHTEMQMQTPTRTPVNTSTAPSDLAGTPSAHNGQLPTPRRLSVTFADEVVHDVGVRKSIPGSTQHSNLRQQQQTASLDSSQQMRMLPHTHNIKGMRGSVRSEKGVMNDTIGTPDDVMEAFMHPEPSKTPASGDGGTNPPGHRQSLAASVSGTTASAAAAIATAIPTAALNTIDAHTRIRAVLAERERMLIRLMRQRRAELAAMPLGVTEQTRRKAIIEAKKLSLLDLQRVVRHRVTAEMKKLHSPSVQEGVHVPSDHLSGLYRRRDPPIISYLDGYPRVTTFDGVPELPPRHPLTITQDSIRMAQHDLSRMETLKTQRKQQYIRKLEEHVDKFRKAMNETRNVRARVLKSLERYFLEKRRIEERKRKMERIERLKLLRSNDEQAYLKLLKNTKNERLLQLVRQTDNYLMQLGAQVEQQRDAADRVLGSEVHDKFAEELGEKGEVPLDAMRRRRDLYYTVTHSVQEEVRQPSIMVHGTLKPYQIDGLKWMVSLYNNNLNGILADEMGLGKTIQTISLITYLVEMKRNPGPYLVIVPLSTMGNWVRELNLWAPSLEKVEYRGDRYRRRQMQRNELAGGRFNVLLTTYEFTVKDQAALSPIKWQYIIIDEGHRMKNANCKLAMTLGVRYQSRHRLLLTGTPLQNNLTELWALLNFLLPSIFSSSDTFETWFKQPFETTSLGESADLEEEERLLVINRLHQVLRPFLLRRLKTDVETQLPQKVEHVIHCHMSSWQQVLYDQVRDRIGLATGVHNGSVRSFNNLLMQFKKVCNHPFLFYDQESVEFLPPDYLIRASGKFFLLHHMLPKLKMHGHRTLIFSQMTHALDHLEMLLSAIGINYLRLDGSTKSDERQDLLNQFNAKDSPYFCFLLSTRAGGLGLNLQTADTVIIFDSDWNPMMDLQAQDRAHRIGQKNVVTVYRLISAGTVEVNILEQANRKLHVDAQVIQAGQFNNKSTESDRHKMLKDLLREENKEEEEKIDVLSIEELNRIIARTDVEFDSFTRYDEASHADGTFMPLLTKQEELPDWVLKPNIEHKDEEQRQQELLDSHGRGRRKRKAVRDMGLLTDAEWLKVAEGEMTAEEVFEKRKRRKISRQSSKNNGKISRSKASRGTEGDGEIEGNQADDDENIEVIDDDNYADVKKVKNEIINADEEDNNSKSSDEYHDEGNDTDEIQHVSVENSENDDVDEKAGQESDPDVEKRLEVSPRVPSIILKLRIKKPEEDELKDKIQTEHKRERKRESSGKNSKGSGKKRRRGRESHFTEGSTEKNESGESKKVVNGKISNGVGESFDQDAEHIAALSGGSSLKIRFKNPLKKRKVLDGDNDYNCNNNDIPKNNFENDVPNSKGESKKLTIRIPATLGIPTDNIKQNKNSTSPTKNGKRQLYKDIAGPSNSVGIEDDDNRNDKEVSETEPLGNGTMEEVVEDDQGDNNHKSSPEESFQAEKHNSDRKDGTPGEHLSSLIDNPRESGELIPENGIRRSGRKRRKRVRGADDVDADRTYGRSSREDSKRSRSKNNSNGSNGLVLSTKCVRDFAASTAAAAAIMENGSTSRTPVSEVASTSTNKQKEQANGSVSLKLRVRST